MASSFCFERRAQCPHPCVATSPFYQRCAGRNKELFYTTGPEPRKPWSCLNPQQVCVTLLPRPSEMLVLANFEDLTLREIADVWPRPPPGSERLQQQPKGAGPPVLKAELAAQALCHQGTGQSRIPLPRLWDTPVSHRGLALRGAIT